MELSNRYASCPTDTWCGHNGKKKLKYANPTNEKNWVEVAVRSQFYLLVDAVGRRCSDGY